MRTIQFFRAEIIEDLEKKYNAAAGRWLRARGEVTTLDAQIRESNDTEEIYYLKQQREMVDAMRVQYSNETAALHDILKTLEVIA